MSGKPRKLGVYSLGLLNNPHLRDILASAGWDLVSGPATPYIDAIGVWGAGKTAHRGHSAAKRRNLPVIYLEDAFLRSVTPDPHAQPAGLIIDPMGHYVDCSCPSTLENMLNEPPRTNDPDAELAREAYQHKKLSKYNNAHRPIGQLKHHDFVLVVDQLRGDASISLGGASAASFQQMLNDAIEDNPGTQVMLKLHPRAKDDPKLSHFDLKNLPDRVTLLPDGFAIPDLLGRAEAVYCVTSQVGFEAILHGHCPRVYGGAFYAGWGLSEDQIKIERRKTIHTPTSLFRVAMMNYPHWHDPHTGIKTDLPTILHNLKAQQTAHRMKSRNYVALGMSAWKRRRLVQMLGPITFVDTSDTAINKAAQTKRDLIVWAGKEPSQLAIQAADNNLTVHRMEDGFIRSPGLGAALHPPLSICIDRTGTYFDPNRASDLEDLINASVNLPPSSIARAQALRSSLLSARLSKYNVGKSLKTQRTARQTILVPGQVEDDASIRRGTDQISTNAALLKATRDHNPDAHILYKPHPDVEAGLRSGDMGHDGLADEILSDIDPISAIEMVDEVWTMTSLIGFEAVVRGKDVTCLGAPFYAGWGLTQDLGPDLPRRIARPTLDQLLHAVLIDHPLYFDPLTGLPAPAETIVERLANHQIDPPDRTTQWFAKAQRAPWVQRLLRG